MDWQKLDPSPKTTVEVSLRQRAETFDYCHRQTMRIREEPNLKYPAGNQQVSLFTAGEAAQVSRTLNGNLRESSEIYVDAELVS